jgi:LytS/YehU family sensor histidine kinase
MSPHFILNTLNNISSMMEFDVKRAQNLLIKFGELLSYSTYKVRNNKVKLSDTLSYLDKYIELQRLRFRDKDSVYYSIRGNTDNKYIAPMLLIPFVENAFKYGQWNVEEKPAIKIEVEISENELNFSVINYIGKRRTTIKRGIGIKNTQKRLELIYPNKHSLDIYRDKNQFFVKLQINDLSNEEEDKLYSSGR